jgi:hypothetical protein
MRYKEIAAGAGRLEVEPLSQSAVKAGAGSNVPDNFGLNPGFVI